MGEITAPVLSVKQPWATAIALGCKDVENRSYKTLYRGLVFIHATMTASKIDPFETQPNGNPLREFNPFAPMPEGVDRGSIGDHVNSILTVEKYKKLSWIHPYQLSAIIGVAEIYDCVLNHDSEWSMDGFNHWLIRNARPCKAIPWKGTQGFRFNTRKTLDVTW